MSAYLWVALVLSIVAVLLAATCIRSGSRSAGYAGLVCASVAVGLTLSPLLH